MNTPNPHARHPRMNAGLKRWRLALIAAATALLAHAARADSGPMDFLFTTGIPPSSPAAQTTWKLDEFSALRLAPREAGSRPNQHPAQASMAQLRSPLARVEAVLGTGLVGPLLTPSEVADLAAALSKALAAASPDDDVLLISTSRRDQGVLAPPLSVTARLFVQDGALHMIVNETRLDALSTWRAARVLPSPGFGSRDRASAAWVRGAGAVSRRADWLMLDLTSLVAPSAPDPGAAASRPTAPQLYDAQAQRLKGLLSLREQGLISDDEYQRKRQDILNSL